MKGSGTLVEDVRSIPHQCTLWKSLGLLQNQNQTMKIPATTILTEVLRFVAIVVGVEPRRTGNTSVVDLPSTFSRILASTSNVGIPSRTTLDRMSHNG